MTRHRRNTRGQVIVIFALSASMVVGMLGLVVDLGQAENQQLLAQNAADASAMAAGQKVATGGTLAAATTAGNAAAAANLAGVTPVIVYLQADQVTVAGTPALTAYVKSTESTTQRVYFTTGRGGSVTVAATATAKVATKGCGICVLGPTGSSPYSVHLDDTLGLGALVNVAVTGTLATNGDMTASGLLQLGAALTTTSQLVHGSNTIGGITILFITLGAWSETPAAVTGSAVIADPLSSMSFTNLVPTTTTVQNGGATKTVSANTTLSPGYYQGITVNSGATLTLSPGTFYIGNGGLNGGAGSNTITGAGVTIAPGCGTTTPVACTAGGSLGGAIVQGTSTKFAVTAPTNGPLENMLIFSDSNNTGPATFAAVNLGASNPVTPLTGAIYMPRGTLSMTEAGLGLTTTNINSMIDVKVLNITTSLIGSAINIDTGTASSSPVAVTALTT